MRKLLMKGMLVFLGISMLSSNLLYSKQAFAQSNIPVILDGHTLSFDVPPQMTNNRVLVPVRAIFEALGAQVTWDGTTRTVYATKGNTQIKIPLDHTTAYKNGSPIQLDVAAYTVQGRTMVPVRFVSEAFGEQVSWLNQSVVIQTPGTSPSTSSSGTTQATLIHVVAGDSTVTSTQLNHVQSILQNANIVGQLQQDLGTNFLTPVTIHVTNDLTGYRSALQQQGMSSSDVNSIADGSNGVAVEEDIYFPLSENATDDKLRDILAHELTHVLINEMGVGDLTPSWINEGIAWTEGLKAEYQPAPSVVYQGQIDYMRETILDAYATSDWQKLLNSAEDTIHATTAYNVEWQDYFAVDLLRQTYGWNTVISYLKDLSTDSSDQAFQKTFGVTSSSFEASFNQSLSSWKQKSDNGVEFTLNVASTFSGTIGIMPKNSDVWNIYRVPAGTYYVRVFSNGTITGLPGTAEQEQTSDPLDPNTVFVGIQPSRSQSDGDKQLDRSGLALATKYGQSYYLNSWKVDTAGNSSYDSDPTHLGVQLVSVDSF